MVIRAAAEHPGYSAFDRARFLDEPAKRGGRTEFARDRARICLLYTSPSPRDS